jgi:hypothetical protein
MPADDDVLYLQDKRSKLDGRRNAVLVLYGIVGRYDVSNIPYDKKLSWFALSNEVRVYPRVGTGDE